ncbi:MAG: DUF2914 domain-containing protein [bacterium]
MSKKFMMLITVVTLLLTSGIAFSQESVTETTTKPQEKTTALFNVSKFVVCTGVENRMPVGVAETFSASTQKVYAFLDATKITEDTQVTFVWTYNKKEVSKFELPIKKGYRWRTFASKTVSGMKGDWAVELKDANGDTLKTVQFKIE